MTTLMSTHSLQMTAGHLPLFDHINLGIQSGDRLGLIGANGCGKSTLLALLAGELRELDPELVWQCVAPVEGKEGEKGEPTDRWPGWEAFDGDELTCFAHHHKPFELCQPSLQRWLAAHLNRLHGLQSAERALLIASIWQYAPGEGLARRQRLSGKPALIKALRGLLARLL